MTALVKVQFYGDELEAVEQDGRVRVSIRRFCDNLGLDFSSQLQKLKGKAWAVVGEITTTGPDGKQYTTACIDLDTLPGWLFSIDARKVKEQVREKLARYQKEAARILADHFLGRRVGAAEFRAIQEMIRREVAAACARQLPPPYPLPAPGVPRFTVAERCRFKGWHEVGKKPRHTIRRLANALLDSRHQEGPDLIGGTCFYAAHQLLCLDEAIDRVREDALRQERAAGPSLITGVR